MRASCICAAVVLALTPVGLVSSAEEESAIFEQRFVLPVADMPVPADADKPADPDMPADADKPADADMPTAVDYTGTCGASYTCFNGTELTCKAPPNGSRPRETSSKCFCEEADTCK
jgi:hypothetical protein